MKEAVKKVIDTLTQEDFHGGELAEVFGTVQQMHCSRRRLLRRGQEFNVSTIHKSAHTKKSGNVSYAPRIYIYIYIYIHIHELAYYQGNCCLFFYNNFSELSKLSSLRNYLQIVLNRWSMVTHLA